MRVGILGSSDVAKSLARGFLNEGHEVMLGSREPGKLTSWARESGGGASSGTFSDTAKFGELVVLAVNGAKSVEAVQMAGVDNFNGKVVIDATNPLDMSGGPPPKLIGGLGTSGGELNQRALPGAFVVKAFNTVGDAHFSGLSSRAARPTCFFAVRMQMQKNKSRAFARPSVGTRLMSAASGSRTTSKRQPWFGSSPRLQVAIGIRRLSF